MSTPVSLAPIFRFDGEVRVPGDKSISHRALILGALARGRTYLGGLAPGDDVAHTASCLEACGVFVRLHDDGRAMVEGNGPDHALSAPSDRLDCGNSGSTMRMLAGAIAGHPITACLEGDASLMRRPMRRIAAPLREMGAAVRLGPDGTAPMTVEGRRPLTAISFEPEVASAQVKTAVLLAGLFADGPTTVVERAATRDHTERLLELCGIEVARGDGRVTVHPGTPLPFGLRIPGDISSAAFFLCMAAAREGWRVRCPGVGLNPGRDGIIEVLRAMGATVHVAEGEPAGGVEPVGDVEVRGGPLRGTRIVGALVPRLIDELPVIAVLATQAEGVTEIRDAAELRAKESDRIACLAEGLNRMGAGCETLADGLVIEGPTRLVPAPVDAAGDHRLAMAFAVAACLVSGPGETRIAGAESVAISYPAFFEDLASLSAGRR
ncbi:MAG: 3-phosphoshikimate 1-carboxyvinyltransferase [Candidatus Dormibacteria bacterium]|jgi:3-phosphoshikimate 1-carboxyvinyltransferase